MKKELLQPKRGVLNLRYAPDSDELYENPPRFTWLPADEENGPYVLEISKDENFENAVLTFKNIKINFFTPNVELEAGHYFWRYTLQNAEYGYSVVREFDITDDLLKTAILSREDRFKNVNEAHPRLWLSADKLVEFRKAIKEDPTYCNFDKFYENTVKRYAANTFVNEPKEYPGQIRVVKLWRDMYIDCQQAYNQIRFVAVGGVILEDQELIEKAKADLFKIIKWDLRGSTMRNYNDECSFRVAGAIAWGFDWLYNYMTPEEREQVAEVLRIRTNEIATHIMVHMGIHLKLYDSHAIRSLSSVVIPSSIALRGTFDIAEEWLNYAIDYINTLYTPWGGKDGGWSEGGVYWTTAMAFVVDAVNNVRNYTGIDMFKRRFFQKTGDYALYCYSHDTYRAQFSDVSLLDIKPILKTGFNAREIAGVTKNGLYQWYFERIKERETYDDPMFMNKGWWDFYFDEMTYLYNHGKVEPVAPPSGRQVKWFQDIDWVAVHKDMHEEKDHIMFLTKSSHYGCVSHSHADQNSMVLFAYQTPMLIQSGHYIGFNSSMHINWRKQTISQNTILIDGVGQYGGMREQEKQIISTGAVEEVTETPKYVYIRENATKAFALTVPHLENYTREIYFVDDSYFIVVDKVKLQEPESVNYQLHTLYKPECDEETFSIKTEKANLQTQFTYVSAGVEDYKLTDQFEGVEKSILAGTENQWHYTLNTKKANNHVIVAVYHPRKDDDVSTVEVIQDDQGHDVYLYFTKDGETFTVYIHGDNRY